MNRVRQRLIIICLCYCLKRRDDENCKMITVIDSFWNRRRKKGRWRALVLCILAREKL